MRYLPTGKQMREADLYTIEKIGIPSLVLMERAALQVVEKMEKENLNMSKVLVVCGSGNNGGDGYAIARLLFLKGISVDVYFAGNENSRSKENQQQQEIAEYYQIPKVDSLEKEYSVIVDAIFGTGLKRNIEGKYYELLHKLNQMSGIKVAVDIPSGINDENGKIMGIAFRADYTVAIALVKQGTCFFPGAEYAGKILIGDIGITEHALQEKNMTTYCFDKNDLHAYYPKRKADSHKGSYGKVLMIVGSEGMSGAAYLSAKAAYHCGAGLVQIYTVESNRVILQQLLPEAIVSTYEVFDEIQLKERLTWADVVTIGCGLGKSKTATNLLKTTLEHTSCPCVLDADAINLLSEHPEWKMLLKENMILTPHLKEMSRFMEVSVKDITENRMKILDEFSMKHKATCVLKDSRTVVAQNGKKRYLNISGNASMAKAGTGDVLAGMITGILAQKAEPYLSACLGVFLHGLAGDNARENKGNYSVLASDMIDSIGNVLREI